MRRLRISARDALRIPAAFVGIAAALGAVGSPATAKSAKPKVLSGRILINYYTSTVDENGAVRKAYGGCGTAVRVTRLGPGKPFSLETRNYSIPVAPGTYEVVMEEFANDPHNPSQKVTVKEGQTAKLTFRSEGGCYY